MKQEPQSDRRAEPRFPAPGTAHLKITGSLMEGFDATLLDVSKSGFRVRHSYLGMASGELVEFTLGGRQGTAQAMWTRILDGLAETGFRITPQLKL